MDSDDDKEKRKAIHDFFKKRVFERLNTETLIRKAPANGQPGESVIKISYLPPVRYQPSCLLRCPCACSHHVCGFLVGLTQAAYSLALPFVKPAGTQLVQWPDKCLVEVHLAAMDLCKYTYVLHEIRKISPVDMSKYCI